MVDQYLTKRLFPKPHVGCKRRPRRSIKWRNPLTKEVKTTTVPVWQSKNSTNVPDRTVINVDTENEQSSTSEVVGQTDKTIEEELKEFSSFTIGQEDKTNDDMDLDDLENPDNLEEQN